MHCAAKAFSRPPSSTPQQPSSSWRVRADGGGEGAPAATRKAVSRARVGSIDDWRAVQHATQAGSCGCGRRAGSAGPDAQQREAAGSARGSRDDRRCEVDAVSPIFRVTRCDDGSRYGTTPARDESACSSGVARRKASSASVDAAGAPASALRKDDEVIERRKDFRERMKDSKRGRRGLTESLRRSGGVGSEEESMLRERRRCREGGLGALSMSGSNWTVRDGRRRRSSIRTSAQRMRANDVPSDVRSAAERRFVGRRRRNRGRRSPAISDGHRPGWPTLSPLERVSPRAPRASRASWKSTSQHAPRNCAAGRTGSSPRGFNSARPTRHPTA